MTDREKVIDGLEHCSEDGCKGCPYEQDCKMCDGFSLLAKDALELLKKQEPLLVLNIIRNFTGREGNCPSCWRGLDSMINTHYCGECGQAVKWDEAD